MQEKCLWSQPFKEEIDKLDKKRSREKRNPSLSGRLDSNQRPRAPQTRALTNCATSRKRTAKIDIVQNIAT